MSNRLVIHGKDLTIAVDTKATIKRNEWFYASDRDSIHVNEWLRADDLKSEFPFYYKIIMSSRSLTYKDRHLKLNSLISY